MAFSNVREELASLWARFLETPFLYEYAQLEEQFGAPEDRPEVRSHPDYERLLGWWGAPDLHLYDTYVPGYIERVMTSSRSGRWELGDLEPDARLALYFEVCAAEALDVQLVATIDRCRAYFEQVNRMLDLALIAPKR